MKRCPTCKKEYSKDTETHCWLDGTLLVSVQPPLPPIPQQKPAATHPPLPQPPPSAPVQSIAVDKICNTCQKTIHKTTATVCYTCHSPLQTPSPVAGQQKGTQPPLPLPPLPSQNPSKVQSPPAAAPQETEEDVIRKLMEEAGLIPPKPAFSTKPPTAVINCPPPPPTHVTLPGGKQVFQIASRKATPAFKKDSNGNIEARIVGQPFATSHGGFKNNEQFKFQKYALKLKDGTEIDAYKSDGIIDPITGQVKPDPRMTTDCHGLTFTNGEYWINDDQVDKILHGAGYKKIADSDPKKPGDILVYRTPSPAYAPNQIGSVEHTVTVTKVNANGAVTEVSGLGGIETKEHRDTPETGWGDPKVIEYYRQ